MSVYRSAVNWICCQIIRRIPFGCNLFNLYHRVCWLFRQRHPNLMRIDLAGSTPVNINFEGCNLCGANMRHAFWVAVNCANAQLNTAVFELGAFDGCNFSQAHLAGAKLNGALFVDCSFNRASLRSVEVVNTTFQHCTFQGANFAETMLGDAHFEDCDLDGIRGAISAPR